ncbi:MAG: adenylate/guanylate cyclase domain-containing protein, partial [Treponema sp.]|nr:adenylate/guanylate cyclase domain-containing protein [Treponema sp.]
MPDTTSPSDTTLDTQPAIKAHRPIGAKLVGIISVLLLFSLGAITVLVSVMVTADVRITAEDNNFNVNFRSAAEAERALAAIRDETLLLLDTLDALDSYPELARIAAALFFRRNPDVAAIAGTDGDSLVNDAFFAANGLDAARISDFIRAEEDAVRQGRSGEFLLRNAAPVFGLPLLALFLPRQDDPRAVFFSPESLAGTFGAGTSLSFLVNDRGELLIHPDGGLTMAGTNMASDPFVKTMRESGEGSLQTRYNGEDGTEYFGAFRKLSLANAAVITTAEYAVIFEGVNATTRRNLYLTGAVLCIAV